MTCAFCGRTRAEHHADLLCPVNGVTSQYYTESPKPHVVTKEQNVPEFKFKVGDLVMFRTAVTDGMVAAKLGQCVGPMTCMVIARGTWDDPQGPSPYYLLSGTQLSDKSRGTIHNVTEVELMLVSEWDGQAQLAAFVAASKILKEKDA